MNRGSTADAETTVGNKWTAEVTAPGLNDDSAAAKAEGHYPA
jgi:hypothetical protein